MFNMLNFEYGKEKDIKMLGLRISKEMENQILHISQLSKRSKSSIVKEALERYLEDMEDYYIALERLEQHKRDDKVTYSLEEVAKELGLDYEN